MGACDKSKTYFVIWTTTTWTLPGNVGHLSWVRNYEYTAWSKPADEYYVMARELVASTMKAAKIDRL